jgi:hypothetical protein
MTHVSTGASRALAPPWSEKIPKDWCICVYLSAMERLEVSQFQQIIVIVHLESYIIPHVLHLILIYLEIKS